MAYKLRKLGGCAVVLTIAALILLFAGAFADRTYADDEMKGSCENGFVEDINLDHTAGNPRVEDFAPEVTEYDVIWTDAPTGNVMPQITIPEEYVGSGDANKLFVTYIMNGAPASYGTTKNIQYGLDTVTTKVAFLYTAKKFLVGANPEIVIRVGKKAKLSEDGADNFSQYDEYVFHLKRQLIIKQNKFQVKNGNTVIDLSPKYGITNYREDYLAITSADSVKLVLESNTAGTDIYVGNELYDANKEYALADFRNDPNDAALIPISLKNADNSYLEGHYNLIISPKDYTPNIITQPQGDITVEKDSGHQLSVDVEAPGKGELSYQWYAIPGSYFSAPNGMNLNQQENQWKTYIIPNATDSEVVIDQEYAHQYAYYCM